MQYLAIGIIGTVLWLAFEIWRAPLVDKNENIIIPAKQLKDLFKRKTK
jgi:hypothetical protein